MPRRDTNALQLVLPVALALLLLAATATHARAVWKASDLAAAGQGDSLLHVARQAAFRLDSDADGVEAFIADSADTGLRCIAVFGADRVLRAHAGQCHVDDNELVAIFAQARPGRIIYRDDTAFIGQLPPNQMRQGPPPRAGRPDDGPGGFRPPRGHGPGPRPPRGDGGSDLRFGGPDDWILVGFDPFVARELRAGAIRVSLVGGLAGIALIVAGFVLRRSAARTASLRVASERDRHLAALGEMSAVIAHEIRNPLASLKGHAQLLAERLESPRDQRTAERVVSEAQRLERLTTDLLDFVAARRIQRVPTDVVAVVRASIDAAGVDARAELDTAPARWSLDGDRMRQALINLLRNAAQAAPEAPPPTVAVQVEGGALVIQVRDHGPGIDEAALDTLFEPFHTTRVRGTGLGLAVVRAVVERHGGTVDAANGPEGGAIFTIRIPAD